MYRPMCSVLGIQHMGMILYHTSKPVQIKDVEQAKYLSLMSCLTCDSVNNVGLQAKEPELEIHSLFSVSWISNISCQKCQNLKMLSLKILIKPWFLATKAFAGIQLLARGRSHENHFPKSFVRWTTMSKVCFCIKDYVPAHSPCNIQKSSLLLLLSQKVNINWLILRFDYEITAYHPSKTEVRTCITQPSIN